MFPYTTLVKESHMARAPTRLAPIELFPIFLTGNGLGLRASEDHMSGDPVFVSRPIGIVYGPVGKIPTNEELIEAISKNLAGSSVEPEDGEHHKQRSRLWIDLLAAPRSDPSTSGGTSSYVGEGLLIKARGLLGLSDSSQEDHEAESNKMKVQWPSELESDISRDLDAVGAVSCNSYGEACEDVAVAELKVRMLIQMCVYYLV